MELAVYFALFFLFGFSATIFTSLLTVSSPIVFLDNDEILLCKVPPYLAPYLSV